MKKGQKVDEKINGSLSPEYMSQPLSHSLHSPLLQSLFEIICRGLLDTEVSIGSGTGLYVGLGLGTIFGLSPLGYS